MLFLVSQSLHRRGLVPTEHLLQRLLQRLRVALPGREMQPQRLARIVDAAADVLPHATCLARSLVLAYVCAEPGAVILIGVARGAAGLDAHAWVELNGAILNDSEDVRTRYRIIQTRVVERVAARPEGVAARARW